MEDKVVQLKQIIEESDNIVFFGGAGVSTESGIPDFNQKYKFPPEEIISHSFYMKNKEEFYRFYKDRMLYEGAQPNVTHKALAKLEQMGKLKAIVTQNIDGLHQMAGSKVVYELHGSVMRNYCEKCGKFYDFEYVKNSEGVPHCECGGDIKPDVVLYEEGLDEEIVEKAIKAIEEADVLIIGGTSLIVYPAAGLIDYYKGDKLVLINKTMTIRDSRADLVINDSLGKVFSEIMDM